MKKRIIRFILCCWVLTALLSVFPWRESHAATTSQNNIVARADYMYNDCTWVCQQNVTGWRGYLFTAGNTYRIPYGQPVYAGSYIGYGVSIENYLAAAATPGSIFYTSKSNYAEKYSTFYANDCSAFVSWCWGIQRCTTYTIPNFSTYIGMANITNVYKLQLGDCLNSNSAGHVVLVTDLVYNASGTLTQIEITEQTPPQLKRSYYTPSSLANYYGAKYGIYRYTGTVPAAPASSNNTTSFGVKVSAKLKNWVFRADYYRNKYSDLADMSDDQLYQHYLKNGISEGRQASALFNVKYYLNQNEGLKDALGSSYEQAFKHFVDYGQYEAGRVYSKQLTAIRDVIFDADFYCAKYPSVYESFGNDEGRLFANFIKTGLSKGYTASPVFDVSYYITANPGLETYFHEDYYGAMHHFISNGQSEIRVVSPILDTEFYTGLYSDTAGMTTLEAMQHYLTTGLKELRQGSGNFLPEFYYLAHAGKLTDYTAQTCYIHYLTTGYGEGLRAVPYAYFPENPVDLGSGFTAAVTNRKSGLNWSVSGSSVILYGPSESDAQKWKFTRQDDGSYVIENVLYGTVLTTSDNGSASGVITLEEDQGGKNQRWFLYEVNGFYSLGTACNSYIAIGLTGGSTESATTVEMASYRNNDAQKYTLTVLSSDSETCTNHNYLSTVTVAPGCTTAGQTTYTCVHCNDSYTETLAPIGHNYTQVVTEVTCTTDGFTTHTCENCGDVYQDGVISAPGHNWQEATCSDPRTCTVCQETEGQPLTHSYRAEVTPPTCVDEGYTTYTCEYCGDIYALPGDPATGHSYADGVCTKCNADDPDYVAPVTGKVEPKSATLSLEDEVLINLYFIVEEMDVTPENVGMLIYNEMPETANVATADTVIEGGLYNEANGRYMVSTPGIPGQYLADSLYLVAYAKDEGGNYVYARTVEYSGKKYCTSQMTKGTEELKATCVALMNYGAAAQQYFAATTDYTYEALMNEDFAQYQDLVVDYSEDLLAARQSVDPAKAGTLGTDKNGFAMRSVSMSADGDFSLNYYFTTDKAADKVTFYYWTADQYSSVDTLTLENASGSKEMVLTDTANRYWANLAGIAAKDIDKTVFACGVYEVDGVTYSTGVFSYSIGYYCTSKAAGTDEVVKPFAKAIAVYSYHARIFLETLN